MKYIIIVIASLLLTNFFGATSISNTLLLLALLPFVILGINEKSFFKTHIIAILIGLFFNMMSCYYYREQSVFDTFKASVVFYYIMFYFVLRRINPSLNQIEKSLFILILLFCICYIIQFTIYPTVIFKGMKEEFTDEIRIRLVAQGFASLGYFWGLNNLLIGKRKAINFFLTFLCLCVIFTLGFRTMLAALAICTLIITIRYYGFSLRIFGYGILATIVFIAIIQLPFFDKIVNTMLERQSTENFSNPDYIRITQFLYFTKDHFNSTLEYLFGSGMAFEGTKYKDYMDGLTDSGIYFDDWGLLGLSWIIGIGPVLFMIAYALKAFRLKVEKENIYIGIWFLYLVLVSLTTGEFYRSGNLLVQAIALYMVEKAYIQKNVKLRLKKQSENQLDSGMKVNTTKILMLNLDARVTKF